MQKAGAQAPSTHAYVDRLADSPPKPLHDRWTIRHNRSTICGSTTPTELMPCSSCLSDVISDCTDGTENDGVAIIANDQGNRNTPSYVAFTNTVRLIGDAAKNQTPETQ